MLVEYDDERTNCHDANQKPKDLNLRMVLNLGSSHLATENNIIKHL
jgi:hypothetical protein